jgi:hypothetical protein
LEIIKTQLADLAMVKASTEHGLEIDSTLFLDSFDAHQNALKEGLLWRFLESLYSVVEWFVGRRLY